jgi:hypothetical protein
MKNTTSARSKNYQVTVDSNNEAYVEKYNYSNLFDCIYDRIRKAFIPQLKRFKALPRQPTIEVNQLEILINEGENRIIITDKKTGISNRAIGFLR